jgi:hypothetical protein
VEPEPGSVVEELDSVAGLVELVDERKFAGLVGLVLDNELAVAPGAKMN